MTLSKFIQWLVLHIKVYLKGRLPGQGMISKCRLVPIWIFVFLWTKVVDPVTCGPPGVPTGEDLITTACWDHSRPRFSGVGSLWGLPVWKRAKLRALLGRTVHTNDWSTWEEKGLASHQFGHHCNFRILCRYCFPFPQPYITVQLLPWTDPVPFCGGPFLKVLPNKYFANEQPGNSCIEKPTPF